MNYFFSDPHAWHTNIIKYASRPFTNALEMTQAIASNINKVVTRGDLLYCLGDWCIGGWKRAEEFRSMIDCPQIILIKGNHDPVHDTKFVKLFTKVYDYKELRLCEKKIILFHYPIEDWNGKRRGSVHLHGHTHDSNECFSFPDQMKNRKNINVEFIDYTPIPETSIIFAPCNEQLLS